MKNLFNSTFLALACAVLPSTLSAEIAPLEVSKEIRAQASTGIGYIHAKSLIGEFASQGYLLADYDVDALTKGFREALMVKDSEVKTEDFKVAMNLLQAKLQERELALSKANMASSEKWLEENGKKEGIQTTKSGLQYQVVKMGEGTTFPKVKFEEGKDTRRAQIRYISSTKDGIPFEQSPQDQFLSVRENLLPGLDEALQIMPEGSHWKLFLKPELAYGAKRVPGKLAPGELVVIDVFLGKITK